MAGFTNRGKKNVLDAVFKATSLPTNYYIHLVSDTPTADTNTLGDLVEVPQSNGYTPRASIRMPLTLTRVRPRTIAATTHISELKTSRGLRLVVQFLPAARVHSMP